MQSPPLPKATLRERGLICPNRCGDCYNCAMEVSEYRQLIQEMLTAYSEIKAANAEEVEAELVFDLLRDRYQVVHTG